MTPTERLDEALGRIEPVKAAFLKEAQNRLDRLTKPQGSLGRLEELARRYVAIREDLDPRIEKKRLYLFAADHGVVEEGVSAYPKEVTRQMVLNFVKGGAAITVLARAVGAEVMVVDIGVDHEFGPLEGLTVKKAMGETQPCLLWRRVRRGTGNIAKGPAMGREEALLAIAVGIELAEEAAGDGVDVLGTGEMGIGNTTPASAIAAVLTGRPAEEVTGYGTGLDQEAWARKVEVVKRALAVNRPDLHDPVDLLAKVGGLEIAGLVGLIVGGAASRLPILVDGFIATAAAALACELCPTVRDYLILSHRSTEPGHLPLIERIGLKPLLDLSMRLGEGTGAALTMALLEASVRLFSEMATFEEAGVSRKRL